MSLCVWEELGPPRTIPPPPPPPTQPSLGLGLKICNVSQQQILNGERFKINKRKDKMHKILFKNETWC